MPFSTKETKLESECSLKCDWNHECLRGVTISSSGCGASGDMIVAPTSQAPMKELAGVPHADAMIELVAGARGLNGASSWCNKISSSRYDCWTSTLLRLTKKLRYLLFCSFLLCGQMVCSLRNFPPINPCPSCLILSFIHEALLLKATS